MITQYACNENVIENVELVFNHKIANIASQMFKWGEGFYNSMTLTSIEIIPNLPTIKTTRKLGDINNIKGKLVKVMTDNLPYHTFTFIPYEGEEG